MKSLLTRALPALMLAAALSSCSNAPNRTNLGHVEIRLTDAPGDYEQVNIVVTSVSIHRDGSGWETLKTDTTTYDLLTLRNGVFTGLAEGDVPAGHYTQIRLGIGEGSHVVKDGVIHPLEIPSGMQSGYKLVGEFDVPAAGTVELTLDFDAERSILRTGNGRYKLKPTVRVVVHDISGRIIGHVLPEGTEGTAYALQGADTLQTGAFGTDGRFVLGTLPAGSYEVLLHPTQGYRDTTLTDVVVNPTETTDVGDVELTPQ